MFFWYIGLSVLGVATIFRSVGVDYRLIALGSMLPLLLDLPFGYRSYGYTLVFAVVLLAIVMLGTIGRPRLLRRRLLCLPIGVFAGLVLSGAFANTELFWWPFLGTSFTHDALLPSVGVVIVEELIGLFACWWVVGQYDLYLPAPRATFFRTGRLVAGTPES
ncbi:MAG: hypothetical protein ABWY77_04585 [Acidimicrobiia bacterium]